MNDARSWAATTFTWSYLDMTALGRQEEWEDSPPGYPQTSPYDWWIWHDNLQTETSPQRSAPLPGQQPTFTPVASERARGDDQP